MTDVKLVINGQEFPLYYKMLLSIAENLPNEDNYKPLVQALLALDIPSVTYELVIRELLNREEMDAVWAKGVIDSRRGLAESNSFLKNLTDAQAREMIDLDDSEILKNVARYAEVLYPDDDDKDQAARLSGQMADTLLEFISEHPNSVVRERLMDNTEAPEKFRPRFAEMIKKRDVGWINDLSTFRSEDIEALNDTSLANLKVVAGNVEDIKDKQVRAQVVELLCGHPDPIVRLELAENYSAPKSALRKLVHDPDRDVAATAAERLEEGD